MNYFGTDGIRGVVGASFNIDLVVKTAKAVVRYLAEQGGGKRVVVGWDTRESCDFIVGALSGVLAAGGAAVLKLGVVPSGALGFLTRELCADLGIMITASHNPAEWNGIKLFSRMGGKLDDTEIEKIEFFMDGIAGGQVRSTACARVGRIKNKFAAVKLWEKHLTDTFGGGVANKRIAFDCANGSGFKTARNVMRALGFNAAFFNKALGGNRVNLRCGANHGEFLGGVMKNRGGFDVGFAFDGDADRCVIFDENGRVVHGDAVLFLLARAAGAKTLVSTVMFNSGVERSLEKHGIKLVRTAVGDRFVMRELLKHTCAVGGEASGHVLFPHLAPVGDGLLTALMVLKLLCESGKTMSELCAGVEVWPSRMKNIAVTAGQKAAFKTDKVFYKDGCRVLIRASGTENIVRVFVEGASEEICERVVAEVAVLV